ncbi:MAG: enoyl-CoA hydratase [Burkholderiaceae bacterium]
MTIRIESRDGVLSLGFDRPERKNAITAAMYAQLADGLAQAASDDSLRVVLIHGDENVFTAGNDLADFRDNPPSGTDTPVQRFLQGLLELDKPLIAAVCGHAVGVGTTMLLHCDLVYAGDNAKFATPFVNLGLCPEAASSLLLPRLAGHTRAAEALLFGEPFGAADALAMGLANEMLPAAETIARARERAGALATRPLASLVATKRLMRAPVRQACADAMAAEGEQFRRMLHEPAAREAFAAFMEKRKPDFSRL